LIDAQVTHKGNGHLRSRSYQTAGSASDILGLISKDDGKPARSCRTRLPLRTVIDLCQGSGIIHIRVIGGQLDLGYSVKEHSMFWFDHQSAAGNAGVV